MALPLDGYIRVSQVAGRSGERFQSPGQQRESIQAWANANGVRIGAWHEDLDRSGGTMDRPGMNEALSRIDAGVSGGVVVARLDRFARNVAGGLLTIQRLHEQGARVVSVAESVDPATPIGRAMLGLLLVMGQWQMDQADEHLAAAQTRAAAAGRYAGKPAYGYRRTPEGLTVIDEEAAEVVRRIFRERAAGTGWRTIADRLGRDGIATSLGRDVWAPSTLEGLLRSEAPLGVFVGPRGLRIEDAWEPIVDRELWERANGVRGLRDESRRHNDRLFAGIARCSGCRRTMVRMVNPHGFVSYGCTIRGCSERPTIGAHLLDGHVAALVDERLARIALDARPPDDDGELTALEAARDAADRELEAWRDDVGLRAALGDADWREGILARARARDEAAAAVAGARSRGGVVALTRLPEGLRLTLEDLAWDDRRSIVAALLHSVWVRRSKLRGSAATQHVGARLRVVWADDPDRPEFPQKSGPVLGPVRW